MIRTPRPVAAALAVACLIAASASPAAAHEQREVGPYTLSVGFRGEPVYVGSETGLELQVRRGEEPMIGMSDSLQAEVTYPGFEPRPLDLVPIFQQAGSYESPFVPTSAGAYTFRIFGTIEETEIDELFTSGDRTFDSVKDAGAAQYPLPLPPIVEIQTNAQRGADAADQISIALGLGTAGLVLGLAGIGLGLAARRRST